MGLFGRSKRTVGLDIGSGLIKLVVVDHGSGDPEIVNVATTQVLPDAIVEGEVIDHVIVTEAIRGLFSMSGIKQKKVVVAVGGRDVIVKRIQMERMREDEAREVIRWEAQNHVPFDMESVELDFQVLNPDEDGLQMDALLVAAKRELIENRLLLLQEAGLEPVMMDVDAFALHNAFELNHPEAMQGVVAQVNIGHEVTNVNVLEHGVPVLTRDLNMGTRRLREDLQRERGMTAEESDQLLQGFERSPDLDPFVQQRCEEIAVGVERAAAFLQSASRSTSGLAHVYTSGGGSRVPGLNEVLSERLRVPVDMANPIAAMRIRDGVFDTVQMDEIAPLLMLAIGLALRRP